MGRTNTSKLTELRSKTDRELVRLISSQLERGLTLADEGGEARQRAEQAYRRACAWLPLLSAMERRALEEKFDELKCRLEPAVLRRWTACG